MFGLIFILVCGENLQAQSDADQIKARQALEVLSIDEVNERCGKSDALACWEVAMRLKDGERGAPLLPDQAFKHLLKVCEAGAGMACLDAVKMMQAQKAGMERGYGGMLDILSIGCATGSGEVCVNFSDAMFNAIVRGGFSGEQLENAIHATVDNLHAGCFKARSPHAAACQRLTQITQDNDRLSKEVLSAIRKSVSRYGTSETILEYGCSDRFSMETGLEAACGGLVQLCQQQGSPEKCASTVDYVQMQKCKAGETHICNFKCLQEGLAEACVVGHEQRVEVCRNTETQGVGVLTQDLKQQAVTDEEKQRALAQINLRKDKDRCIEAVRLSPKVCLVGSSGICSEFIDDQSAACADGDNLACDTSAFLNLAFASSAAAKWQGAASLASRCEVDPYLCETLGRFWLSDRNWTEHDSKEKAQALIAASKSVLEMGCDAGSVKACTNRAQIAERLSEPSGAVRNFLSKACYPSNGSGDIDACSSLYHQFVDLTLKASLAEKADLIDQAYRTYEQICRLDDWHQTCRGRDDYLVPEHIAWLIQEAYCSRGKKYDGSVVDLAAGYLAEDQCMSDIRRGRGSAAGAALYDKYRNLAGKFYRSR